MQINKILTWGLVSALIVIILAIGIKIKVMNGQPKTKNNSSSTIYISSPAFQPNGFIPQKYTCEGEDINPPLKLEQIPPQTKSLALIVDDPDAPMRTWNHWLVYNISPSTKTIQEGQLLPGGVQITNSFGKKNYGGPCPPPNQTHRYFFKVYALDTILPPTIKSKKELLEAISNHLLASGQLMGRFKRTHTN